jgi:hypothetical protein
MRIVIISLIVLVTLLILAVAPILYYEWILPNSFVLDFNAFALGELKDITEKQLVKSGYKSMLDSKGRLVFTGSDTIRLLNDTIPAAVSFMFTKKQITPPPKVKPDSVIKSQRGDIFEPDIALIIYDARQDSSIIDT